MKHKRSTSAHGQHPILTRDAREAVPTRAPDGSMLVDIPALQLRAEISLPATIDDEARTVDLIWTTGADVERMDWWTGERYIERLSLDPEHVRLERLNNGAPLLDSHGAYSVMDMLGACVPGTAKLTRSDGRVQARFSRRPEVDGVWQDVRDGLVRFVSVGYRVYRYEEIAAKGNKLPIRVATDWEPMEVSMVPVPADAGAQARGEKPKNTNRCQIVTRAAAAPAAVAQPVKKEKPMDPEEIQRSAFVVEEPAAVVPAQPAAPAPAVEPNDRDRGAAQERLRVQGILNAVRAARLPQSFADDLIKSGKTLVECQERVFAEMGTREDRSVPSERPHIQVGDDPLVHSRAGIENALLHRAAGELKAKDGTPRFALSEVGREYRGMGLMDLARTFLHARGVRTSNLSKMQIAGMALGLEGVVRGMHTTSDFALLLADASGKVLRAAYEEAPATWMPLARRVQLPDFKASKQLQIGAAPELLEVLEHGEFKRGTIAEAKEQFALATYGRIFALTRQAIINDDLDAFSRIPMLHGRAARRLEADKAWAQITGNPTMGDSVALFHADHANLSGSSDAISVTSIGAGRAAMRKQTDLDGESLLNLSPSYLIVPAAKETLADQFVSTNLVAAQSSNVNPFAGRLAVISEPRLDVASAVSWYLSASPAQVDILLHGVLEGQEGPVVESRVGFDVDGVEIKVRLDSAFKAADWRGLYKNPGA